MFLGLEAVQTSILLEVRHNYTRFIDKKARVWLKKREIQSLFFLLQKGRQLNFLKSNLVLKEF